jgi:hypothetical protein
VRIAITTLRSACVVLIALRACSLSEAMSRKPKTANRIPQSQQKAWVADFFCIFAARN